MNSRLLLSGIVLVLAVSAGCAREQASKTDEGASGEKMTLQFYRDPSPVASFAARDLDGRDVSPATWRGKVTIVNFWATWCPPCRAEIPDLVALQEKYRDKVQVIGVSEDEEPPDVVRKFAAQYKMNYPIVMTTPEIRKAFPGVSALPTSFIVDPEGRVMQRHIGMLNARTTDAEARSLAGLPVNATIERIEKDRPTKLANAAQATDIPGVDLSKLSKAKRVEAIQKLNDEGCTCGCNLTVARCRVDDPKCPVSLPRAKEIVDSLGAD